MIECPTKNIAEYIITLQAYDFNGIKTELEHRLKDYIEIYKGGVLGGKYTLTFKPLIPAGYVREMAERIKIKRVRFIKYNEQMNLGTNNKSSNTVNVEIRVRAKRGDALNINERLLEYVNGGIRTFGEVFTLPDEFSDIQYRDVKLEVTDGGRPRTLSLRNLDIPKFSYAVDSSTLRYDQNGYIMSETFLGLSVDVAAQLRAEMVNRTPVSEDESEQE